jgi:ankyrin repeat protein
MGTGEPRKPQPFTLEQRLLEAARRGDQPTIERALALGAPITAADDLGRTLVLLAVKDAHDLDLVRWLHARGAAVDEPDVEGRTALSFAAEDGALETVRYLVADGAAVDRADRARRPPLFHAALGDHADVVAFLLDRGADPNPRDKFGDTPLIAACAKGNVATAALLLARGADPSLRDQEGRTAAERAAPGADVCRPPPQP